MLCQNCGKYEATTHVKRIINGESAEAHLCGDCAHALGYNDVFGYNCAKRFALLKGGGRWRKSMGKTAQIDGNEIVRSVENVRCDRKTGELH